MLEHSITLVPIIEAKLSEDVLFLGMFVLEVGKII